MKKIHAGLAATAAAALIAGCTSTTHDSVTGAGRKQLLIVPQSQVLQAAASYHNEERQKAASQGQLVTSGAEYQQLKAIMDRMVPHVAALRPDATDWGWKLTVINDPEVLNAHVLADGSITFYTGLLRKLRLTPDEMAAVMGHEIAHALREHTRERMSTGMVTGLAVELGTLAVGADPGTTELARLAKTLALDLPFSRKHESEADAVGLELAARAGYNPRGAVTVWEKMDKFNGGKQSFALLSTHPLSKDRRDDLERLLPTVLPLYEQARAAMPVASAGSAFAVAGTAKRSGQAVSTASPASSQVPEVRLIEEALRCKTLRHIAQIEAGLVRAGLFTKIKEKDEVRYYRANLPLFGLKVREVSFSGSWESGFAFVAAEFEASRAKVAGAVKRMKGDLDYDWEVFTSKSNKGQGGAYCSISHE